MGGFYLVESVIFACLKVYNERNSNIQICLYRVIVADIVLYACQSSAVYIKGAFCDSCIGHRCICSFVQKIYTRWQRSKVKI